MNVSNALKIANKRISELEKYNLDLANESHYKSEHIKRLQQPNIFWHKDNPEDGMESAEELVSQFIDEDSVGQIIELEVAVRLPNIKVKILPDNSDGSVNLEYL